MDPASPKPAQPLSTYTPQDDPSKYIRTYAKDLAALSGSATEPDKAAPSAPTPKPAPPAPAFIPGDTARSVTDAGVSLPDYDPSPVNSRESASPKEFEQEKVELSTADSEGIFEKPAVPTPLPPPPAPDPIRAAPLMPQAAVTPAPAVAPPETDADREAILARLRAKVAAERRASRPAPSSPPPPPPMPPIPVPPPPPVPTLVPEPAPPVPTTPPPLPPVPPVPPAPAEIPLRTAAPDFAAIPEPTLPVPQVRKQAVPARPEPVPETSSPLHTYSSDFADRIDAQGSSTFSVLAAQSDAGQTVRTPAKKRTFLPLLAGAAMLLIGIAAIGGAYLFTQKGSAVPAAAVPSLIAYDESAEVKGTGQDLMQAISDVAQGGVVSGNVIVTYTTIATTTGNGIPQPGGELIKELDLSAPDILMRNIADASTVGVIHAGAESRPFLLLKVNSYERTFAGMLAWEPIMADSLATFYPPYSSLLTAGTTTASTSPAIDAPAPTVFTDAVVANYDVRVLRDGVGRSLLLYGYRGKDTLVIARDEAAFTALVSRLNAAGD